MGVVGVLDPSPEDTPADARWASSALSGSRGAAVASGDTQLRPLRASTPTRTYYAGQVGAPHLTLPPPLPPDAAQTRKHATPHGMAGTAAVDLSWQQPPEIIQSHDIKMITHTIDLINRKVPENKRLRQPIQFLPKFTRPSAIHTLTV